MHPLIKSRRLSLALPFLLAASLLVSACGKPPGGPPPAEGTPQMGVITIRTQSITLTKELPGRTVPYLIAEVRPQVSGLIQSRTFREGADVRAGQVLYQINPASYLASYDNARAVLAKAEASLLTTRLKARRYRELVAASAISRQDYDDAQAALGEATADVAAAKANVESARIDLADTRVNAPISGRIGKSSVTTGALVTADQVNVLTTIQQLDPIYIDVTQSSVSLLKLRQAMARGELEMAGAGAAKVQLLLEDGSLYAMEGRLEFADVTVDQGTGSITLRALFPNPKAELLPGMYVRAIVQEGIREQGVLVPQQAVTRDNAGKPIAYVVGPDSKLQLRRLYVERTVGDQWFVQSGLEPGDSLVVEGLSRAREGLEVTTTPWQSRTPSVADESISSRHIF
ncbi:efflux RND transporter periplasmic adaptor subunit [Pseudomonas kulmbachensis]|uniref:Efflux RND transporter periplasmic adaptor subunit n=1 Tax=Pseudomonas kulmbachensis TaxID=3043408 RepID=A0ABW7LY23_9PSED